ncbi:hypothetical protein X275_08245 [Marinitoga sp. 1197]|uniref:hypothetical protein n=1 Tax=Marinitoga sp. 1197 TaxID=1428449 RepID=UPI00065A27C9|nr:hypothetical protein [Marinitoga sp. 1197]KLO21872.1 hypothetical protein X275_08245 [Marinitoga sp. 1197]
MDQLINFISNVGLPTAYSAFLLYYTVREIKKSLDKNTEALEKLREDIYKHYLRKE